MIRFSEKFDLVAAALLAVQREIQPVVKDKKNPMLGNNYVSLDALVDYVRPILARNDCALLQSEHAPAEGKLTQLTVETMILHVSGQYAVTTATVAVAEQPSKDGRERVTTAQTTGAAITYARRYGVSLALGITTEEDTDANGNPRKDQAQRRESRAAPRGLVGSINTAKATKVEDIPFPPVLGFEGHRGKPLKDVPTEALEVCYQRTKDRTEKKAQMVAKAVEQVLEDRRNGDDFGQLHPALSEAGGLVHA